MPARRSRLRRAGKKWNCKAGRERATRRVCEPWGGMVGVGTESERMSWLAAPRARACESGVLVDLGGIAPPPRQLVPLDAFDCGPKENRTPASTMRMWRHTTRP